MKDIHEFLDIHSHNHEPGDNKIINLNYNDNIPSTGYYSIGLHPWLTTNFNEYIINDIIRIIENKATEKNIVAIGECGIDKLRGASYSIQIYALKKQIQISEFLCKPLILHVVKAFDIILALKKELQPKQLWIIHGFRGKEALARQLTSKGIGLSYGEFFNKNSVENTPKTLLFSETDKSSIDINTIRERMSITY